MQKKLRGSRLLAISIILVLLITSIFIIFIQNDKEPELFSKNSENDTIEGANYFLYFTLISLAAENSEWGVEEYHWKVDNVTDGIEYEFNNPRWGVNVLETEFRVCSSKRNFL